MHHKVVEGHARSVAITGLQQRVLEMEQIQIPDGRVYNQEDFNDLQYMVAVLEQQMVRNAGPEVELDSDDESGDEVDGLNAADI
jgi:hypothetical protein